MNQDGTADTPLERRDRYATQFADQLQGDSPPRIEEYLALVPDNERPELFVELVAEEYLFYWNRGDLPTIAAYHNRFPQHHEGVTNAVLRCAGPQDLPYLLVEPIGSGGFGTVYRAKDRVLDRDVAIKVLKQEHIFSQKAANLFRREMTTAARICHANVVPVYASGVFPTGRHYVVMQHIDGQSLCDLIAKAPHGVDGRLAAQIMATVATAIHAVHSSSHENTKIVHGDIKPANILLDRHGTPYVTDFGLAAAVLEICEGSAPIGCTSEYASPEQTRRVLGKRRSSDTRSDIWSLGVVLYELLTGRRPFVGEADQIESAIVRGDFVAPKDLNTRIPVELDQITRKCLELRPNDRYQTAEELAEALKQWHQFSETIARPIDFSDVLGKYCIGYSDRPWLFDEVARRMTLPNEPLILLTGGMGSGKSAFSAELVRRNPNQRILAWHFCRQKRPETRIAGTFVSSIVGMLADSLRSYRRYVQSERLLTRWRSAQLHKDPASAFHEIVVTPLASLLPDSHGTHCILIDALDESDLQADPSIVDLIASWVRQLPEWLRIVATTRPEPLIVERLTSTGHITVDDVTDERVNDDLARFITARLNETEFAGIVHDSLDYKKLIERRLVERCSNNFLYADMALKDIAKGLYSPAQLDTLPFGLRPLFAESFSKRFHDKGEFRQVRWILEMMVAAPEALPEGLLLHAGNVDEYDLDDQLGLLASYVTRRDGVVCFHHHSVADWLEHASERFRVRSRQGHKQLAEACWAEYQRGIPVLSSYATRHLPCHLAESGRLDDLAAVLLDLQYLQKRADSDSILELSEDCEQAANRLTPGRSEIGILKEMAIVMAEEAGFLSDRPGSLFQCLWNRCAKLTTPPFPSQLHEWKKAFDDRSPATPWVRCIAAPETRGVCRLSGPKNRVLKIVASFDAQRAAAYSVCGGLHIWKRVMADPCAFELEWELESNCEFGEFVFPLAFNTSGEYLLAITDQILAVLDLHSDDVVECAGELPLIAQPVCAGASVERDQLAVLFSNGDLSTWDPEHGFRSTQVVRGTTIEAGALRGPDLWLAITGDGYLKGKTEHGSINSLLPETILSAWQAFRNDPSPVTPYLVHFVRNHADVLADRLQYLHQPYISLHAPTGWIAVLQQVTSEEYDVDNWNRVLMWHPSQGSEVTALDLPGESCVSLKFAEAPPRLAAGMLHGQLHVVSVEDHTRSWTLTGHTDEIVAMAFSPEGKWLLSSGHGNDRGDDDLVVVQQSDPLVVGKMTVHSNPLSALTCSPDGKLFATGDNAGNVAVWTSEMGTVLHSFRSQQFPVTWNSATGPDIDMIRAYSGHQCRICTSVFTSDSSRLVTASEDGNVIVWDVKNGRMLIDLLCEEQFTTDPRNCWMDISSDGKVIAATDETRTLVVWSMIDGERDDTTYQETVRTRAERDLEPTSLAVSEDGNWLTVIYRVSQPLDQGWDGVVPEFDTYEVWSTCIPSRKSTHRRRFPLPPGPKRVKTTSVMEIGGRLLLVICVDQWEIQLVKVFDLVSGNTLYDTCSDSRAVGGFDAAVRAAIEAVGSPNVSTTGWRWRRDREHQETSFLPPNSLEPAAWYPRSFDSLLACPDGRTLCGYYGSEVHFLRLCEPGKGAE